MNAAETSRDLTDFVADTGLVGALIALAGGVVIWMLTAASSRRAQRRERYATMAATLSAWIELPYQIKRRVSNESRVLESLTAQIHDLQRQLVLDHADLHADARWLAKRRDTAQHNIQQATKPWIDEAWASPPITSTDQMTLNGWGPASLRDEIEGFVGQLRWRFGPRRLLNPMRLAWLTRRASRSSS